MELSWPPPKRARVEPPEVSSNDALRFVLLPHSAASLDASVAEMQPVFTHQTFGQKETIRGYKGLDVRVFLDSLTFHGLVQIR